MLQRNAEGSRKQGMQWLCMITALTLLLKLLSHLSIHGEEWRKGEVMLQRSAKGNWKWTYIWGTLVDACHQNIGGKVIASQDAKPLQRLPNLHLNILSPRTSVLL